MNLNKNLILNVIGIFLIILGIIRILQLIFFGTWIHSFWLCNHILIFMGIAILFRNSFWLIAEFSFLFFGQLIWIFMFLSYALFGIIIPGGSVHLIHGPGFINVISLLAHFLTLPLGFIAILFLNKKEKFAWKGSILHSLILFPFVIYFGSRYNLNCLFNPCLGWIPNFSLYPIFIYVFYFGVLVIPVVWLINLTVGRKK